MLGTTPEDLAQFLHQEERLDSVSQSAAFLPPAPHPPLFPVAGGTMTHDGDGGGHESDPPDALLWLRRYRGMKGWSHVHATQRPRSREPLWTCVGF